MTAKTFDLFIRELASICQQSEALTWQSVLHQILNLFAEAAGARHAALVLLDEQLKSLACARYGEEGRTDLCGKLPDLVDLLCESRKSMHLTPPISDMPMWVAPIPPQTSRPIAFVGFMGVRDIPPDLLDGGASLVAPLLHNIRLRWEVDQDAFESRRLRVADHALGLPVSALGSSAGEDVLPYAVMLNRSLDLEQILNQILDQLAGLLPYDAGRVMLLEERRVYPVRWRGYGQFNMPSAVLSAPLDADWPSFHRMLKTREPLVVSDTTEVLDWFTGAEFEWVKAHLAAPIVLGSEVFGFITLDSASPDAFTELHAQKLKTFANQAAIAIQNAQFYQAVQRRATEISTLYTVAVIFATTLDFRDALKKIVECLVTPLNVDVAWVSLPAEEHYHTKWQHIPAAMSEVVNEPVYRDLYQQIVETGQRSVVIDVQSAVADVDVGELDLCVYLGVPLAGRERALGVLNLGWHSQHAVLEDEYLTLLDTIGQQIGIGLERIFLFQEAQRRQAYQESLNDVIAAVNQATNLNEILELGLEKLLQVLGLEQGAIYLHERQEDCFKLQVQKGWPEALLPYVESYCPMPGRMDATFTIDEMVVETELAHVYPYLLPDQATSLPPQISLPLVVEGNIAGIINLGGAQTRFLNDSQRQLLNAIVYQLALAVQRGQLAAQLQGQLRGLYVLYEVSAAFLAYMGTSGVLFILLRTLSDLLDGTMATAFYQLGDAGAWRRQRVYISHKNVNLARVWREGQIGEGEDESLNASRREQMLVLVSRQRGKLPAFWPELEATGVRQLLYFPIFLPNSEFFGILAVLLSEDRLPLQQELALAWAVIRQGTAAVVRVQNYEAIREGESRMRAILESSRDGIFLVGNNLTIRYVNRRAMELVMLPGSPVTWEGRSLPAVILALRDEVPTLARHLIHVARELLAAGATFTEAPGYFETAHSLLLTLQHWPVYAERNVLLGGLVLLRDVTEQKSMEQMRDDLLNMLVHDMRAPLAGIQNALELLENPVLQDKQTEILSIAKARNEQMLMLVNDILDIGRLEAGRVDLQEEPVLLSYLVKRVLKGLLLQNLDLNLDLSPDLPILWIDTRLVERVFHNILSNAIKFATPQQGKIRVFAVDEGAWVRVGVYNDGPHIPPMLLKRLFGKFVAGGDKDKRGYGLGLAFCRLVVEAHGGRIWASNEPEGGVTLYFTLPVAPDFDDDI